jgi:hypothetical protein
MITRVDSGLILADDEGRRDLLGARRVLRMLLADYESISPRWEHIARQIEALTRAGEMVFDATCAEMEGRGMSFEERVREIEAMRERGEA